MGLHAQESSCQGVEARRSLSPFLFIIAMEALSCIIKEACSIGLFHGITSSPYDLTLSHFLFADDVVFIAEWSTFNARNPNRLLRCLYLVYGLRQNLAKSSLYGVCVEND